ncbi:MAG TPA: acyl-CoA dehydrogenase family protein [Mycobacteriales bacterium]|nr:acyl-CoA dehydrogenase family protein [Mycobacteriales bacterium]
MDSAELRLFTDAFRQSLTRQEDGVDEALAAMDWRAALADDPAAATRAVFGVLGELNAGSSALDDVLTFALGLDPSTERAVVLPPIGRHTPPATYDRAQLTIRGLASARVDTATEVLVVVDGGKQHFLCRLPAGAVEPTPVHGIDPGGGWRAVHGQVTVSEIKAVSWDEVVAAGQLALAQQLTGAARAVLGLAREHAVSRSQFDRPIASFQAVRHKLAESLVAVEGAEAVLDAGWSDRTPFAATMAKIAAGTAARTVAKHAQQVLAGMGFTSEHPFHRYLKRTMLLDALLGSSAALRREVGAAVVDRRALPPLLPL